jgi:lysophospholipase L1-like esterase
VVGRADNFSRQVDRLLKAKRFPDLLLIWIGHNNLCWTSDLTAQQKKDPEVALRRQTSEFKTNYVRQLRRILDRAKKEDHKISIVVFGLVNTKAYVAARETAEAMRRNDRKLFPYAEVDYVRCEAMKPEYRGNIVRLELAINRELRSSARALGNELRGSPNVRLQYSGVLAEKDIDDITLLSSYDAWHLSRKGHDLVAQTVFDALKPSFDFLGIRSEPRAAKH